MNSLAWSLFACFRLSCPHRHSGEKETERKKGNSRPGRRHEAWPRELEECNLSQGVLEARFNPDSGSTSQSEGTAGRKPRGRQRSNSRAQNHPGAPNRRPPKGRRRGRRGCGCWRCLSALETLAYAPGHPPSAGARRRPALAGSLPPRKPRPEPAREHSSSQAPPPGLRSSASQAWGGRRGWPSPADHTAPDAHTVSRCIRAARRRGSRANVLRPREMTRCGWAEANSRILGSAGRCGGGSGEPGVKSSSPRCSRTKAFCFQALCPCPRNVIASLQLIPKFHHLLICECRAGAPH